VLAGLTFEAAQHVNLASDLRHAVIEMRLWMKEVSKPIRNRSETRADGFDIVQFHNSFSPREQKMIREVLSSLDYLARLYVQAGVPTSVYVFKSGQESGAMVNRVANLRGAAGRQGIKSGERSLQSYGIKIPEDGIFLTVGRFFEGTGNRAMQVKREQTQRGVLEHELWHPYVDAMLGNTTERKDEFDSRIDSRSGNLLLQKIWRQIGYGLEEYQAARFKLEHGGEQGRKAAIFDVESRIETAKWDEFFHDIASESKNRYYEMLIGVMNIYLIGYQAFRFADPDMAERQRLKFRNYLEPCIGAEMLDTIESILHGPRIDAWRV